MKRRKKKEVQLSASSQKDEKKKEREEGKKLAFVYVVGQIIPEGMHFIRLNNESGMRGNSCELFFITLNELFKIHTWTCWYSGSKTFSIFIYVSSGIVIYQNPDVADDVVFLVNRKKSTHIFFYGFFRPRAKYIRQKKKYRKSPPCADAIITTMVAAMAKICEKCVSGVLGILENPLRGDGSNTYYVSQRARIFYIGFV